MYGRLKGYNECASEYVSFIDDDDISTLSSVCLNMMIEQYGRPIYTNSIKVVDKKTSLVTHSSVLSWSFQLEKQKKTKPHQTMIVKTTTALEISKLTCKLIKYKKWPENCFDYVYRVLISLELGWDYYPIITYEWRVSKDSLHIKDMIFYIEISNYFFQHVGGLNLPSYEKDKVFKLLDG
jgi:hypothetical protein